MALAGPLLRNISVYPMTSASLNKSTLRALLMATLMLVTMLAAACSPEVGDECGSSQECGTIGLCDTASPGGYCTQTPCETNSCPIEAVCVEFENEQTYCMKRCSANGDCRSGYICRDDLGPVKFCGVAP